MDYIAIDGGATKTLAAVFDLEELRIRGVWASGPSNYRNIGIRQAAANIKSAIAGAIENSDVDREALSGAVISLASARDSARSDEAISELIHELGLKIPVEIYNDAEAGYYCRFVSSGGLILAPGTGMNSFMKLGDRLEKCSGWGWFMGDEGSAFYIGKRALQEMTRYSDGRLDAESELFRELPRFFGVRNARDVMGEVYTDRIDVRKIASIATVVSRLADEGDRICVDLLRDAAEQVAGCAIALLKSAPHGVDITVSGYGGVFRAGEVFSGRVRELIREKYVKVEFKDPVFGYHAVVGSIILRAINNRMDVTEADIDRLIFDLSEKVEALPANVLSEYLLIQ